MGIVKSAAAEYAGRVRVNSVCPATIDTPMVAWFAQRWPDFQVRAGHSCLAGCQYVSVCRPAATVLVRHCADTRC
jgi:NAD(P)-dependent dehydrogenase (short-subunit alcohol dehydrogenase family)